MKNIGLMISSLNGGGAERVVSHLSFILAEEYNVHLILFESDNIGYNYTGKLHDLEVKAKTGCFLTKVKLFIKRVMKVRSIIQTEDLQCVISFLDSPNFVNLFSKVSGCKTIISVRNYSALENGQSVLGKIVDQMMKLIYRKADKVVVVSKLMEKDFIESYRVPHQKICTIYNPYNFSEIQAKCYEEIEEFEDNFYNDHFVYVNVGRIMYQKGIWHLVKAFHAVYKENENVRLVLVGEDHTDGKLEKLILSLGLQDVVLRTGVSGNPYKYMQRANVYVLTSLFEGFPNAMVEGMACGCAIIASDCKSGPREILCKNPNLVEEYIENKVVDYGILVPALEKFEDWEMTNITNGERNLAEAMMSLLKNEEVYKELAQKAKERSFVFDYGACKKGFIDIIEC